MQPAFVFWNASMPNFYSVCILLLPAHIVKLFFDKAVDKTSLRFDYFSCAYID